jgi:hypothetical protein
LLEAEEVPQGIFCFYLFSFRALGVNLNFSIWRKSLSEWKVKEKALVNSEA